MMSDGEHSYTEYKNLLEQDFYKKPVILIAMASQYDKYEEEKKVFEYEEIFKQRSSYKSTHHNAYSDLCTYEKESANDRFYYCIKSLQYDVSKKDKYESTISSLFFELKLFESQENTKLLQELFSDTSGKFFEKLSTISAGTISYKEVKAILEMHESNSVLSRIMQKDLVQYIYANTNAKIDAVYPLLQEEGIDKIFRKHVEEVANYSPEAASEEKEV